MAGPVLTYLGETKRETGGATGAGPWKRAEAEGVHWLVLDRPGASANTIDRAVLEGLDAALDEIDGTKARAVVLRSDKAAGFAAGADIAGFADMTGSGAADLLAEGHRVLDRLEALPCPTIAVIHGAALGAGFEIALACDWRIAVRGASFGFPEVRLGLHPGLGGTMRLPRLIDPLDAMRMMLTGSTAHTKKAKKLGIADIVTEERHVAAAVAAIAAGDTPDRTTGLKARALRFEQARKLSARKMRSETAKSAPEAHYPAPHALIDIWEEHADDREAMVRAEIESFARLLETETHRNLRRVFFLRQRLKEAGRGEDGIAHVHVIGAGTMGAEIAAWSAVQGKRVTLGDVSVEALGRAVKQAKEVCEGAHLGGIETRDALDRMMPDPNGYGIGAADLVIEAAPEKPEVKAQIYADLGARMKPDAILATNTSSLDLSSLREAAPDATRFAGLHFFNPVSRMQLVEVVRHDATDPEVADRLAAFCGAISRLPVKVADYPGFLVNRALMPYLMEALVLMDEGVSKDVIDRAALDFGMPMGPVTLADQVGLDICLDVAESLIAALEKPLPRITDTLRERVADGKTGKKAGEGFHDWSDGTPHPDPDMADAPEDLTDRLILPMLDACVECLRAGVAAEKDDVDAAMIFATGFAPFRGGPMHHAGTRGAAEIRARLEELAAAHGKRFAPDPGWADI